MAKCGGNYAATLLPQVEAKSNRCDQAVFLVAVERKWVKELGGMNVFLSWTTVQSHAAPDR